MFTSYTTSFLILCSVVKLTVPIKVPRGFKFGAATASYQVEGGWNVNGKGPSIWDTLTHSDPELIKDRSTGDIACDSYHLWKEDIKILEETGVDFYRFSLSWPRILPTGFTNRINPDGVRYYNNLINELLIKGIEPVVTIYHWDLPQPLQDIGGWTNPQISEYFADFAGLAYQLFGDRVKKWITLNEPPSICPGVYEYDDGAPPVKSPGIGTYLCGKTILLAHAKAYRVYEAKFRNTQKGKVGITIDSAWFEPNTNSSDDSEAALRALQMNFGWWTHPIFSKEGNYPKVMIDRIANISKVERFSESRLPPLSKKEIILIRGSADFLGLNHYRSFFVSDRSFDIHEPTSFAKDVGISTEPTPTYSGWALRKLLNWIKDEYYNPLVYITENGIGDNNGTLQDTERIDFLKDYITSTLQAATEDNCNIAAYTVWSIMDNMEWRSGYTIKFGIYHVDFGSENRTRTPKNSAKFYRDVIKNRSISD